MLFKLKKEQQFYLEQHINKAETCLTQSSLTIIFNYYQLNSQDSFTAFTKRVDQLLPFLDFTTTDLSSQYKQALDFIHKRDYASLYDLIRLQHNC